MPPPPSLPLLLLPFSSPILPTSASRLHAPTKSLALSPRPRPPASYSPSSSSFAVAAAFNDDEDVVLGDCLVFEDGAFEDPSLDLGRPSRPRRPRQKSAGGGSGLVSERWRDAVEEINLTKKEKRRIAHGLRFGSRLDRRVPSAVAAPDELRAYREGRLDYELPHDYVEPLEDKSRARREAVRLDSDPGHVYRDYVEPRGERSRAPEMGEVPPPPDPAARVAPRNPRVARDAGGLEDIAELFSCKEYVPGETEDGKSPRRKLVSFWPMHNFLASPEDKSPDQTVGPILSASGAAMPPPPSLPLLLLPFSSPILPTSASRLHAPTKSLALSPRPRPPASYSPSYSFAVAAAFNDDEDVVLGDCLVFDDQAFEDPSLELGRPSRPRRPRPQKSAGGGSGLVPERWRDAVEEINLTKKEKRRIAHGLRFGSRLDRRVPSAVAAPDELRAYREGRLDAKLPRDHVEPLEDEARARREAVRLDSDPGHVYRDYVVPLGERSRAPEMGEAPPPPDPAARVAPRNPRVAMDAGGLEDIAELFSSKEYVPGETEDGKSQKSRKKLFTDEEKALLNKRLPDLEAAASSKWLPLHTLAASGDFYLLDNLLKHKVDVNALDKDGFPAIHKAVISKKHAIINYLLRNSANPFICDKDGATLMHYAVQTACNQTIKTLLLYNVDINRPDDYGWTPLHLAVQAQRTDIVRLLLLKGADRTLKTQDGFTPVDLCLRLGHHVRTYELIKLLKNFRLPKQHDAYLN